MSTQCPNCNSDNIVDVDCGNIDLESITEYWECRDCGADITIEYHAISCDVNVPEEE